MKKIASLLLFVAVMNVTAQESVLLQYNLKKGDKYLIEMSIDQNMEPIMNINIGMNMIMESQGEEDGNLKVSYNFSRMAMNMASAQGDIKFDSDVKDEDLDEVTKKMKEEMAPFLEMVMYQTMNKQGKVLNLKFEPEIKGADQFMSQSQMSNMEYPKEPVKVGTVWRMKQDINNMSMNASYLVTSIKNGKVYTTITALIGKNGEGKMKGNAEIDSLTGMIVDMKMNMSLEMGGADRKSVV